MTYTRSNPVRLMGMHRASSAQGHGVVAGFQLVLSPSPGTYNNDATAAAAACTNDVSTAVRLGAGASGADRADALTEAARGAIAAGAEADGLSRKDCIHTDSSTARYSSSYSTWLVTTIVPSGGGTPV